MRKRTGMKIDCEKKLRNLKLLIFSLVKSTFLVLFIIPKLFHYFVASKNTIHTSIFENYFYVFT